MAACLEAVEDRHAGTPEAVGAQPRPTRRIAPWATHGSHSAGGRAASLCSERVTRLCGSRGGNRPGSRRSSGVPAATCRPMDPPAAPAAGLSAEHVDEAVRVSPDFGVGCPDGLAAAALTRNGLDELLAFHDLRSTWSVGGSWSPESNLGLRLISATRCWILAVSDQLEQRPPMRPTRCHHIQQGRARQTRRPVSRTWQSLHLP